jgi:RES domain-containing protein
MRVTPHPEYRRLREALAAVAAARWQGVLFRFAAPEYASSGDLLTGQGARVHGGRWNPPGSFAAVYGSLTPEVAMAETFAAARRHGIPDAELTPRVIAAARATLARVVDLTRDEIRGRLGVTAGRMVEEPWAELNGRGEEALTQAIGRAAHALLLEGLIVPSSASPGGRNAVLFPDYIGAGALAIYHPERLPPAPGGG